MFITPVSHDSVTWKESEIGKGTPGDCLKTDQSHISLLYYWSLLPTGFESNSRKVLFNVK